MARQTRRKTKVLTSPVTALRPTHSLLTSNAKNRTTRLPPDLNHQHPRLCPRDLHHATVLTIPTAYNPSSPQPNSPSAPGPWLAVNSILTRVPAIKIADPFVNVPHQPPQPSDHAITQNTINIGTMFGTEKDQINSFLQVNTAVNLYARRLPNSTEVWVLCHFTQTTDRDSIYTLFSDAAGALSAPEMQHFQPYTLT
ncbi:hypothetical protein DDE82_007274 [Stemphylium lycopersici]|nr:hypothetical protein DDE82_007274 [Stemphylium lycopersici]